MKNVSHKITYVLAALLAAATMGWANPTRTPVPGTVNYVEGQVTLDGRVVPAKSAGSAVVEQNQTLNTHQGKAEMLLVPGVFLRVGDESQVQMLSPDLDNTKVRVTKGSAMLEVDDLFKQNNLAVDTGNVSTRIDQRGLYSFNADTAIVGVVQGKATVYENDRDVTLKKGHEVAFVHGQPLKSQKLDKTALEATPLYRWSELRSDYEAQANLNATQTVLVSGGWYGPGWYWAPYWNLYSFIPPFGMLYSPFGWGFFSPGYVLLYHPAYRGGQLRVAAPAFRETPRAMPMGGFHRG
jgi:hypothetical protein